jgi:hypothetical protein
MAFEAIDLARHFAQLAAGNADGAIRCEKSAPMDALEGLTRRFAQLPADNADSVTLREKFAPMDELEG